jgi:hypothetical protein
MKRIHYYLILSVLLLAVAVFLYLNSTKGTLQRELRDFAVEDTAGISKIFMVDKQNNQITLVRKGDSWMVNNKFQARKDAMDNLLEAVGRLDVRAPVPKAGMENVVRNLSAESIKVEIYSDDNLVKTYYVGGPTQDHQGTYMLLEGSSVPFVMSIPGFSGFLTIRYIMDENLWQGNQLFCYQYKEIRSVSVFYPAEPQKSFIASHNGDNTFRLQFYQDKKDVPGFDTTMVFKYLGLYKMVNYEARMTQVSQQRRDSILSTTPVFLMTVEDIHGGKKSVKGYIRPADPGILDDDGKPIKYDIDRMYAFIDGNQNMVTIQYFNFDPLLLAVSDFVHKTAKK